MKALFLLCALALTVCQTKFANGGSQTCLSFQGQKQTSRITGRIVAYDLGVEQASHLCRQHLLLATSKSGRNKRSPRYVIVRREDACNHLIPERELRKATIRRFDLVRTPECDQFLKDLLGVEELNPTGEVYRLPLLKWLVQSEQGRVPRDTKLICYSDHSDAP